MQKRYSAFDYTITITRKNRYLVVGSAEFGFQVASSVLEMDSTDQARIGTSVLNVLGSIEQRLRDLDRDGRDHPEPVQLRVFSRWKKREIFTCRKAAKALGVSNSTLRRMVRAGLLQAEKTPGGHLRFTLDSISNYLGRPDTWKGVA